MKQQVCSKSVVGVCVADSAQRVPHSALPRLQNVIKYINSVPFYLALTSFLFGINLVENIL